MEKKLIPGNREKRNYAEELDTLIGELKASGRRSSLLLHACCAPCASYPLEYLSPYFDITVFFYNPNMDSAQEYIRRSSELERFLVESKLPAKVIIREYDPDSFYAISRGLEGEPEGGERCFKCYGLRLKETARLAAEKGFDYFATTLSISPHKNAAKLNEIGEKVGFKYGVKHLPADFKKHDGFKRSIELSMQYGLYRQSYCGCVYSKEDDPA
ncbi:MAG: epoxyqueuosine reductase QueH [Lachnospiraceae bacterium]|nr:epoxyqueuosine reductase QueH [Lachnospiraceae bacterium]